MEGATEAVRSPIPALSVALAESLSGPGRYIMRFDLSVVGVVFYLGADLVEKKADISVTVAAYAGRKVELGDVETVEKEAAIPRFLFVQ